MLGNTQVIVVPFVAWLVLGERVSVRLLAALPLVCGGVVLISGVLETGAYGDHPIRGVVYGVLTGLSYAGFILVLRQAGADLRRPAGPLFDATAVATVAAVIAGLAVGEADLVPTWPAHGWLLVLALSSQVARLAADHRLAPAPPRRADLGDADDPAGRLGVPRRDPARREPQPAAARRRRLASSADSWRSRPAAA